MIEKLIDSRITVPGRLSTNQSLLSLISPNPGLDFGNSSSRSTQIRFVHDNNVGNVEHRYFLKLQTASVIR